MIEKDDPRNEGHAREWQDRARVVLDAKESAEREASPNQSPAEDRPTEDVEEKSEKLKENKTDHDPAY